MKPIRQWWWLDALAREITSYHASHLVPYIQATGEPIWDEQCPGLGRTAWRCGFIIPNGVVPAPEIMGRIRNEIERLQQRFDLGLTAA